MVAIIRRQPEKRAATRVPSRTLTEAHKADSTGRRNTSSVAQILHTLERFGGGVPTEYFAGSRIEGVCDRGELIGFVSGQVSALREILAE